MSNIEADVSLFDNMPIEELQVAIDDLTEQLREAKTVMKNRRTAGVRAAIEARRDADVELSEELRKLGYSSNSRTLFLPAPFLDKFSRL